MNLSGPHQIFANGIASGLNATQAYLAAYPKVTRATASANGSDLLRNTKVAAEVARLRAVAEKITGSAPLTLAEKYDFLALVVRTPVRELTPESILAQEWIEETTAFGGKTKIKMPCKLRALELHAKLSGELSDKVKVEGPVADALTELMKAVTARGSR